jgi:hypothetical protein
VTETATAAKRWAAEWERCWREHDSGGVAALYADGASFRSAPFRDLQDPRAYAEWAFADEDAAEPHFREPFAVADDRAVVEWWAVLTGGGKEETLAGVSLLRFDDRGLVVDQHDYWNIEPGRKEL